MRALAELYEMWATDDAAKLALAPIESGCNDGLIEVGGAWWRDPDWTAPPLDSGRRAALDAVAAAFPEDLR